MLLWQPSPFIVPVVSQPWFTVMDRILKVVTGFVAVSAITICFSRFIELHEKVIGAFIEKYMFY